MESVSSNVHDKRIPTRDSREEHPIAKKSGKYKQQITTVQSASSCLFFVACCDAHIPHFSVSLSMHRSADVYVCQIRTYSHTTMYARHLSTCFCSFSLSLSLFAIGHK